jgi:hypothetical protein
MNILETLQNYLLKESLNYLLLKSINKLLCKNEIVIFYFYNYLIQIV